LMQMSYTPRNSADTRLASIQVIQKTPLAGPVRCPCGFWHRVAGAHGWVRPTEKATGETFWPARRVGSLEIIHAV
ncbi:MAG: hypothetical protein ACLP0A_10080, partial [Verrucomicrobiia bacterium]